MLPATKPAGTNGRRLDQTTLAHRITTTTTSRFENDDNHDAASNQARCTDGRDCHGRCRRGRRSRGPRRWTAAVGSRPTRSRRTSLGWLKPRRSSHPLRRVKLLPDLRTARPTRSRSWPPTRSGPSVSSALSTAVTPTNPQRLGERERELTGSTYSDTTISGNVTVPAGATAHSWTRRLTATSRCRTAGACSICLEHRWQSADQRCCLGRGIGGTVQGTCRCSGPPYPPYTSTEAAPLVCRLPSMFEAGVEQAPTVLHLDVAVNRRVHECAVAPRRYGDVA